jgi:L-alanine-DL-glutamate epimerase-like enolase superfamily enzyme
MVLMHDPVQQYTVDEAIKVGRELEKLGYLWIEEPLQESDIHGLKRLSDALDMHVLALESVQGAPYLAVPYLSAGAIDIVRQTGLGITGQMKLANLAEMFGVSCHGGNPHVVAAIRNDDWWEHAAWPPTAPDRVITAATSKLIRATHRVEDGYMYVPQTPGLGREIDWDQIADRTVLSI